jgi:hypothetical protein
MARVIQDLRASGGLGRYAAVAQYPGFARAVGATIEELRLGLISAERIAEEAPGLAEMAVKYGTALASARLADGALLYEIATRRLNAGESHPWIGLPILLLDVARKPSSSPRSWSEQHGLSRPFPRVTKERRSG